MKLIALPLWLFFAPMQHSQAQNKKPVNPQKDKVEFNGYTIKLLPTIGGNYGYNVLKGTQLVIHQSYNPFTMSPAGLQKKEDAYKVAKWQITHLKSHNNLSARNNKPDFRNKASIQAANSGNNAIINERLAKNVATELNINLK
jgi:hypothetical protein